MGSLRCFRPASINGQSRSGRTGPVRAISRLEPVQAKSLNNRMLGEPRKCQKNRRQPANRSEVRSDEEVVPGTQSNGQHRGQKPFRAQNPLKTVDGHRTPDVHDDPCCGCWCRCASARQRALCTISEISMRELILTPANWRGGLRMKTHARFNATRTSQSCSATHSRALTCREHVVRERNLFRRDGDAI
jgi:hypothetical protein